MKNYQVTIGINYADESVTIECPEIHHQSTNPLQTTTIGHILTSPIKLIVAEVKEELKAIEESTKESKNDR